MNEADVAIVTGAGSGIGRCVCSLLADARYRLVLVGRSESKLKTTMAEIKTHSASPPEMLLVPADLTDAEQAMSVVDTAVDRWGRLDALVNNAGVATLAPIESTTADLLSRTFAANAFSAAYLIGRAWPIFQRQGRGCIVNVSSLAAADPFNGFFVYAASKSALESMTRSAMKEGEGYGVRAFTVAPGAVETPMLRSLFSERDIPRDATLDPNTVAHVVCDCILGRRDAEVGGTIDVLSP